MSTDLVHHLADAEAWAEALRTGTYRGSTLGRTLEEEGFVHCSAPEQVAGVLGRYYADHDRDLVLLTIDPDRLAVGGWSNGGFLTNCIITRTNRFKAAISGAGIVDAVLEWGANDEPAYVMVFKQGFPWNRAEKYHQASPTYRLDKARTPTLIHVGANDERRGVQPTLADQPTPDLFSGRNLERVHGAVAAAGEEHPRPVNVRDERVGVDGVGRPPLR